MPATRQRRHSLLFAASPASLPRRSANRPRRLAIIVLVALALLAAPLLAVLTPAAPGAAAAPLVAGAVAPTGLHVAGNRLLDGAGRAVVLHGVNRSGSEYACIQGWGFFDGDDPASDAAQVPLMRAWGVAAVNLPLNEDCWLGINGVPAAYGGANYQAAIRGEVAALEAGGITPILALFWAAPGSRPALDHAPMPDADHAPAFWGSVAAAYAGDSAVVFRLAEEPHPAGNADTAAAWRCWRDGGAACAEGYAVAGMQTLVDAVRATGAANVIQLPGIQYANALSQFLAYRPADPLGNLMAAADVYPLGNTCGTVTCYEATYAPVAAALPLVAGEVGESADGGTCTTGHATQLLDWLDAHGAGYLAWAWDTWGGCLQLIQDYRTGAPQGAWGRAVQARLLARAADPAPSPPPGPSVQPAPSPSSSPTSTGPVAAMPIISRGVPAFASSGGNPASNANDSDYSTLWSPAANPSVGSPQWLAYNLAGVPTAQRGPVVVGISNDPTTSDYYQSSSATYYNLPRDYTIEANAAPGGGSAPTTGWVTLATVTGNAYNGRMHQVNLTGYNWLRLSVTAARNGAPMLNLDVFDVSAGTRDVWLLLGDSITAEGAAHANISGSAWSGGNLGQLIAAARPGYSPLILDGGTGGMTMGWAAQNAATLLAPFTGRYVGIGYGTNDANNAGALGSAQVSAYYQNLLAVVDAVEARGMVAVVPTIPWGCASGGWLGTNAKTLNDYVAAHLWTDRPQVVRGPDLFSYFQANPGLLRDCIHPTYTASSGALNGYEQWQRLWRDALLTNVYAASGGNPSPPPTPSPSPSPTPQSTPNPTPSVSPSPTPTPSSGPSPVPSPAPTTSPAPAPSPGPTTYLLTVLTPTGGVITPTGRGSYAVGSAVTARAIPADGYLFTGWLLDNTPVGWANPFVLTMDAPHTLGATFAPRPAFGDVAPGDPAAEAIAQLAARGNIHGYDATTFGPDDPVLRAQMAALIARAMDWPDRVGDAFTDRCDSRTPANCVDDELWNAVAQLSGRNVARGYSDPATCRPQATPCFDPRSPVLAAQALSFITRAMIARGYWQPQPVSPGLYGGVLNGTGHEQDVATYIHYTQAFGGVPGYPVGGTFPAWDRPTTRAWFARALWTALDSYLGAAP